MMMVSLIVSTIMKIIPLNLVGRKQRKGRSLHNQQYLSLLYFIENFKPSALKIWNEPFCLLQWVQIWNDETFFLFFLYICCGGFSCTTNTHIFQRWQPPPFLWPESRHVAAHQPFLPPWQDSERFAAHSRHSQPYPPLLRGRELRRIAALSRPDPPLRRGQESGRVAALPNPPDQLDRVKHLKTLSTRGELLPPPDPPSLRDRKKGRVATLPKSEKRSDQF